MNKITEKLTETLDISDEMELVGDDVVDCVRDKTQSIDLLNDSVDAISLDNMVQDFSYVRSTLKENTDNARRVLNSITLELLSADDDKKASLIMSFAELNKAVTDNMKLYVSSYKDISNVLINLDKLSKGKTEPDSKTGTTVYSTVDIIKEIGKTK